MPDYIIIGGQRCGTTTLYNYLTQHPSVAPVTCQEVHFFDLNFHKGTTWYRSFFPSAFYKYYVKHRYKRKLITGEASAYYMFHPHVPERMSRIIPQVKLIALLRNPVDRAHAHYCQAVRFGIEHLSFEHAIRREDERLNGQEEKMFENQSFYSYNHQQYSYLARGVYIDQLKVWMSFFAEEQILILRSEDTLFDGPAKAFGKATKFLDLPDWAPKEFIRYNYDHSSKMNPSTRKWLIEYFEPHNQRLYRYLSVNFGWDK